MLNTFGLFFVMFVKLGKFLFYVMRMCIKGQRKKLHVHPKRNNSYKLLKKSYHNINTTKVNILNRFSLYTGKLES